jgi:hemerythrin superfamily protein
MYTNCKRDNALFDALNGIIISENITEEQKATLTKLRSAYAHATYKEYDERHEFYRNVVGDMINDCGFRDDELAEKLANDHPTLQQNFMRLCRKFISRMARKTYYDDRNKDSVTMAKKMMEAVGETACLPFV